MAKIAGMYNPESMGFFIIVSQRGRKIEGEATRKGSVAKEKGRRGREGESRGYSSSFSPQRPARAVFNAEEREREHSLQVGRISCGDDAPLSVSFPSKPLSASR